VWERQNGMTQADAFAASEEAVAEEEEVGSQDEMSEPVLDI
jgi:hypothetical protein